MNPPYLFPEERVLDIFHKAWFESPDRVNKFFSKAVLFIDTGSLIFTNMRLIYQGKKFFFPIEKITFIGRHKIPGKFGMGQGYVRVDAVDPANYIHSYFFAGGGTWVWTVARRSDELFGKIIAWNENICVRPLLLSILQGKPHKKRRSYGPWIVI